MQRKTLVPLMGILSIMMGGCDFIPSLPFFGGNSSNSPTPVAASPTSSPVSIPKAAGSPLSPPRAGASPFTTVKAAPQAPKTGANAGTPGVAQSPANTAAAGLLSSTLGDEALRNNPQGRADPFALPASIQPLVKGATGATGATATATAPAGAATNQRPIPSLPQIPLPPLAAFPAPPAPRAVVTMAAGGARGTTTAGSNTPPARTSTAPVARTNAPARAGTGTATVQPFTPQLPALPEPSLARLVEVSGIVDVAGASPKAIVKAPNETSSRYVSPGERLSDGLILVKRIEMTGPGGPVVILEQFGVEVTRRVGDRPPTTNQAGGRPT